MNVNLQKFRVHADIGYRLSDILNCATTGMVVRTQELNVLGAFTKLRKVILSFVLSVCPTVRVEQLGFHCTDFHEI